MTPGISVSNASIHQAGSFEENGLPLSFSSKFRGRSASIVTGAVVGGLMGFGLSMSQLQLARKASESKKIDKLPDLTEFGIILGSAFTGAILGGISGYFMPALADNFKSIAPCSTTQQSDTKRIE
ncbi:hypothetical protein [Endozoicomonas sp.]|uniref:hypothetical protein n=1 Tax=Endozoicomonas sp. TaxID=1892382 RepID=UPI00383B1631